MPELTVFIKVKIPNLKDSESEISLKVSKEVIKNNEKINTITDKKYLLISVWFTVFSEKVILFTRICLGLEWESKSFIENFIKVNILKNLIPELVEKKDPPIITNIKYIK